MKVHSAKSKVLFSIMGTILWLLIIPIKLFRFTNFDITNTINNNGASFLGSAGLLFMILGSKNRLSALTLSQATIITIIIALSLEFLQLVFQFGVISLPLFRFDILDIVATLFGIFIAYFLSRYIIIHQNKFSLAIGACTDKTGRPNSTKNNSLFNS